MRPVLRPDSVLTAWLLCFAVIGVAVGLGLMVLQDDTAHEREARRELGRLRDAPPHELQIIVVGNSRSRSAFGHEPTLETALRAEGVEVGVANLSGGGTSLDRFEPLLDDIISTDPDVVIIQTGTFPDDPFEMAPRLIRRVRVALDLDEDRWFDEPQCQGRTDETLGESTAATIRRYGEPAESVHNAERFVERIVESGASVYVFEVPRARALDAATEPILNSYRAAVNQRFADREHVLVSPLVELGDLENYCDYTHLNAVGQQQFIALFVPPFLDYLAEIEAGE